VVPHRASGANLLAPVTATLRSMFGTDDLPSLAPGLLVVDDTGWLPATRLIDGSRLPDLLDSAGRRWQASAHAAAALAWKSYSYWLTLPAMLGWASARRVPLLLPTDVLMRSEGPASLLTLGLRPSITVAVLPSDPLARSGSPQVRVVGSDAELLAVMRESLLDAHLNPLVDAIRGQVRLGARTLLGSVSSGIAHGILRASPVLPRAGVDELGTLLGSLGIESLIDLVPGPAGEPTVRRKTCCLAFTLPRPKVCAGCCIMRQPAAPRPAGSAPSSG
jgi:hypothetical protein